jgi:hypothetical protein
MRDHRRSCALQVSLTAIVVIGGTFGSIEPRLARADEGAVTPTPVVPAAALSSEPVGEKRPGQPTRSPGFYGGPEAKITAIEGSAAVLAGIQGGYMFGDTLVLGASGYMSVTDSPATDAAALLGRPAHIAVAYGGLRVGGVLGARQRLRLTYGLLAGGGVVGLSVSGEPRRSASVPLVEPDVQVEFDLTRFMRIAAGFSYRLVAESAFADAGDVDLSGPAGSVALRFGNF